MCYAQNIIPNPGFEKTTGCPGAFVFLKNVDDWCKLEDHRGTPDQYYADCEYNGKDNPMHPGQYAYEGKGHAGSFCFGSNLREYMTTPLTEPMVRDSIYNIEFYILPATGYGTFIDSYGVHFSGDAPSGGNDRSLAVVPLEEHVGNQIGRMIDDTVNWTKISGTYKARGGEQYATFGNFRSDGETNSRLFNVNTIVPGRSYMLIDGVDLRFASDTVPEENPVLKDEREHVVRSVFITEQRTITIAIWDHVQEDGDLVHLYFGDKILLENHLITKKKKQIELDVLPGEYLLNLHALNLGSIPPNTAAIRIADGRKRKTFVLSSDMNTSECIRVVVE